MKGIMTENFQGSRVGTRGANESAVASFLAANSKAMLRPLVAGNNDLIIGFKAEMKDKVTLLFDK